MILLSVSKVHARSKVLIAFNNVYLFCIEKYYDYHRCSYTLFLYFFSVTVVSPLFLYYSIHTRSHNDFILNHSLTWIERYVQSASYLSDLEVNMLNI